MNETGVLCCAESHEANAARSAALDSLVAAVVIVAAGTAAGGSCQAFGAPDPARARPFLSRTRAGTSSIAYLGRAASEWIAEGLAEEPASSTSPLERCLPGSSPVSALRTAPLALLKPLGNQVLAILASRLDPRSAEWSMGATPSNIEAYNEFFDGLDLMSQGVFRGALAHWKRAAALDSTVHPAATQQRLGT